MPVYMELRGVGVGLGVRASAMICQRRGGRAAWVNYPDLCIHWGLTVPDAPHFEPEGQPKRTANNSRVRRALAIPDGGELECLWI